MYTKIFILLTGVLFTVAARTSAFPGHEISARNASTALTCGNPSDAIPFLREFVPAQGDHLYSANVAEILSHVSQGNSRTEGEAGYIFSTQEEGTVPLHRMFNGAIWDHYYSVSATIPAGYSNEGIAGYVYPTQVCGSIPLYLSYSPSMGDHFYTTSLTEKNIMVAAGGYIFQHIEAYDLPFGATGCTPK